MESFGKVVRTPDERFASVKGWPYAPRYLEDLDTFVGLRLHYIDEGSRDVNAETFLCIHGEPTWSFMYRKMLPVFLASSSKARVVAPDLFGFGRSDKFVRDEDYSFEMHRRTLVKFVERLNLKNITLVVHDWGGVLGLTLPLAFPERIARLIIMNTALSVGATPTEGFLAWREYARKTPNFPVGPLIKRGTPHLTDDEVYAYDAPFPTAEYKAGTKMFPQLVPDGPDKPAISRDAANWWGKSSIPVFMAIGMKDPVLGPKPMLHFAGTVGSHLFVMKVDPAGHFVPEWGKEIAEAAIKYFHSDLSKIPRANL